MRAEREEPGQEAREVLERVARRAAHGVGDVQQSARGRDVEEVADDGGHIAEVCVGKRS